MKKQKEVCFWCEKEVDFTVEGENEKVFRDTGICLSCRDNAKRMGDTFNSFDDTNE